MPVYLGPKRTSRYFGEPVVPHDVLRRRRSVYEALRRFGAPVLIKERYTDKHFKDGLVDKSPVYSDIYEQTRNRDPLSYGTGYVSKEKSKNEWYNEQAEIITSVTNPGAGWSQAPRYRGFGPSNLTYIIEPDRAEDFYKATIGGPIFKVQTAQAIAPWWPDIDDNDLIIQVVLDAGGNVIDSNERFEAKSVQPTTMRGRDRRGRKERGEEFGNVHVVNQSFEMALIPRTDILYEVDIDR